MPWPRYAPITKNTIFRNHLNHGMCSECDMCSVQRDSEGRRRLFCDRCENWCQKVGRLCDKRRTV